MPKSYDLESCGLAGLLVLVSIATVHAQSASSPPEAAQSGCSGLMCIFGSRTAAPPPGAPGQSVQTPQQADPATRSAAVAAPDPVEGRARAKPKSRLKAVHPITIAADAPEVARLKSLSAAMPKEKIRIVKTRDDAGGADFAVSTTLDERDGAEKAKLFTEQMHIVAGGAIRSIADLKDKVVSFGPEKSTSQGAGRKAFKALNIPIKETPLELDNALDGLSTGDIDAVVVLAPQPDERLRRLAAPGLHLVSWPENGSLPAGTVASSIDGSRYPALAKPGETIRAMGVDAVLTLSRKGARQPAAKTFLTALSQHSAQLSRRGFDLIKADLESRSGRRLASADKH